jgi:hypothetical protein
MKDYHDLGYESERHLVAAALSDARSRETLRLICRELAERVAVHYLVRSRQALSELANAGMADFDRALAAYRNRWGTGDAAPYRFTTYFVGWIKRSIGEVVETGSREQ